MILYVAIHALFFVFAQKHKEFIDIFIAFCDYRFNFSMS